MLSPRVFNPERFIDERLHKYVFPNPFIFLPFNAGLCNPPTRMTTLTAYIQARASV